MPISTLRIQEDLSTLARYADDHDRAREYVKAQLEAMGCHIQGDAAGNLHARPAAISWDSLAWMSGSNLESDQCAAGVVAALETMRAAREDVKIAIPLELVVWAGRMSGSAAFAEGIEAKHNVLGFIEIHADPASVNWDIDAKVACVTDLAGRRFYQCGILGEKNQSVLTPMSDRKDALAAAAEAITAVEKAGRELGHDIITTVSQITCFPNTVEAIANQVSFTIDLRCAKLIGLAGVDQAVRKGIEKLIERRGLTHSLVLAESQSPLEMDARVCAKLRKGAAARYVEPFLDVASSESFDVVNLTSHIPVGMLFTRENPDSIAAAAAVLLETVRDRRLE